MVLTSKLVLNDGIDDNEKTTYKGGILTDEIKIKQLAATRIRGNLNIRSAIVRNNEPIFLMMRLPNIPAESDETQYKQRRGLL